MPVGSRAPPARLAKVNIAGQLADDENVQTRHQFRLQAGRSGEFWITNRRAKVGKQTQAFAQTQNRLFRPQTPLQGVVFPVTDCAKQHRVRPLRHIQSAFGQRMAMGCISCAANQRGFGFKRQIQRIQDFDSLGHNFRADAVAGKDCNVHRDSVVKIKVAINLIAARAGVYWAGGTFDA